MLQLIKVTQKGVIYSAKIINPKQITTAPYLHRIAQEV